MLLRAALGVAPPEAKGGDRPQEVSKVAGAGSTSLFERAQKLVGCSDGSSPVAVDVDEEEDVVMAETVIEYNFGNGSLYTAADYHRLQTEKAIFGVREIPVLRITYASRLTTCVAFVLHLSKMSTVFLNGMWFYTAGSRSPAVRSRSGVCGRTTRRKSKRSARLWSSIAPTTRESCRCVLFIIVC